MLKPVVQQIAGTRPKCVNPNRMRRGAFPMYCCTFVLVHDAIETKFTKISSKTM